MTKSFKSNIREESRNVLHKSSDRQRISFHAISRMKLHEKAFNCSIAASQAHGKVKIFASPSNTEHVVSRALRNLVVLDT